MRCLQPCRLSAMKSWVTVDSIYTYTEYDANLRTESDPPPGSGRRCTSLSSPADELRPQDFKAHATDYPQSPFHRYWADIVLAVIFFARVPPRRPPQAAPICPSASSSSDLLHPPRTLRSPRPTASLSTSQQGTQSLVFVADHPPLYADPDGACAACKRIEGRPCPGAAWHRLVKHRSPNPAPALRRLKCSRRVYSCSPSLPGMHLT